MSIPEAVNLIIHAACMTQGDDIFILRMGEKVQIVELAERMIRLRGLRPGKDIEIRFIGIRPGEKLHEELYSENEELIDTVHPGIVCLQNWSKDFEREEFLEGLDQLLSAGSENASKLLQELVTVEISEQHPDPKVVTG